MLLQNGQVVVSERQVGPDTAAAAAAAANDIETWLICDGNTDTLSNVPGSKSEEFVSKLPSPIKTSYRMELLAVISSIFSEKEEGLFSARFANETLSRRCARGRKKLRRSRNCPESVN